MGGCSEGFVVCLNHAYSFLPLRGSPSTHQSGARPTINRRRLIRRRIAIGLAITALLLAYLGTRSKPAIADSQVMENINKTITIPSEPTWAETIAPQLAARDAQIAEEARQAELARQAEIARQAILTQPSQSGSCSDWMAAAGISDPVNAYKLIQRESGCNPSAVNAYSGACGIGQQLPCGKWPHAWNDPIGGLIDMQNYVYARCGSWANALAHSYAYNNY